MIDLFAGVVLDIVWWRVMKTYMGVSRDSRDNIFLTAIKYLTSLDLSQYFEIEKPDKWTLLSGSPAFHSSLHKMIIHAPPLVIAMNSDHYSLVSMSYSVHLQAYKSL